jgi:integrase
LCLASNIARRARSASYYARLGVPKDLQQAVGRKELWESLRTKDAREARARVAPVLARWHDEFAALRRRLAATYPTAGDIEGATWGHYQGELEHHHHERRARPTAQDIEAQTMRIAEDAVAGRIPWGDDARSQLEARAEIDGLRNATKLQGRFRAVRRKTLEEHLGQGETVLVRDAARALIARENWAIKEDAPEFRDLCERLQRAEIEGLRRAEEQDRGDFTGRPADPIVKAPAGKPSPPIAAPGESILDLLEAYSADNRARITPDTLRVNRQVIGMFVEFVGATVPASAIDKRRHVFPWKEALRRYPTRAAEIGVFQGMSFRKIIAENARLGRPTLSDKTVNRYLSALGGFCTWAHRNGHMDDNPVTGMLIEKGRGPSKVRPYDATQLTTIFRSPLFVGCLADGQEHKPGTIRVADHRYWLPLLSLFTGARMGELAQLLVADVREDNSRWIIHITREGDAAKTTKTSGSQRVIPLHPELERLGFRAFHARHAATGEKRLFPEIVPDARGQLTGNISRWWGRFVTRIGVKNDDSVNFHSFRHGMADALRRAGFRDEEFGFLLGHTRATTTGRYGILSEGDLTQRCKMIDAVNFPNLELHHLYQIQQNT